MGSARDSDNELPERPRASGSRPLVLALVTAAGVVALLLAMRWAGGSGSNLTSGMGPAATRSVTAPVEWVPGPGDYTLRPGEPVEIEGAALAADRPVSLDLTLVEPSRHAEPLPVQVRDTRGRVLDRLAPVEVDERMSARLEIDPSWLLPGTYLVELRTTEQSHFPMRRYAFAVR